MYLPVRFVFAIFLFIQPVLAEESISVDPDHTYQTMDGIGANMFPFPIANGVGWNWEKVKFVFDELDISYIRMAPWFVFWEMNNDNDDPNTINWDGFDGEKIVKNHDLKMAEFLKSKNIDYELGIWKVKEWLADGTPKTIPPEKFPEIAESIVSYIKFMNDNQITTPITEMQNEPDIAAAINYLNAENLKNATLALIDQFDRHQLSDIKLHGPNLHSPKDTVEWGTVLLNEPKIKDRYAAISYHTWWVDDFDSYDKIRKFAEKQNLPVWATEVGFCALKEGCKICSEIIRNDESQQATTSEHCIESARKTHYLRPETWDTAWDYALSHYRAIKWSGASRSYHWALLGNNSLVSKEGVRFPSFYILKHFANYIPKGAVLVKSESSDDDLLTLIFKLPGENTSYSAIVINTGNTEKPLTFKVNNAKFKITSQTTSVKDNYMRDKITQTFPPESVTSLQLERTKL
jgi:O-glycosyl hydrolase